MEILSKEGWYKFDSIKDLKKDNPEKAIKLEEALLN